MSVLNKSITIDFVRLNTILVCLHAFGIFPYARQHCPYSFYFAGKPEILHKQVLDRQEIAHQIADSYWIDELKHNSWNMSNPASEVAVVVITMKRHDMDYLKRTLAAINENLIVQSEIKTGVLVCNTDLDFESHVSAQSLSVAMTTYNVYQWQRNSFSNDLQKETHDFRVCLNESLNYFRSEMFLVMEDDMIVLKNSARRLKSILGHLHGTDWTALKLFYPLQYQGYELTLLHVLEIAIFSALITGFVIAIYCLKYRKRRTRKQLIYLALTTVPFVVGTFLLLGRQHSVLVIYHYFAPNALIPFPSGSTGAIVFSREKLFQIIQYLHQRMFTSTLPIDFILRDYFRDNPNESAFLVQKSLFAHVGFSSSIPGRKRDPKHFLYYA